MSDHAWDMTLTPTAQAFAFLFQLAVALLLFRVTTRRREARLLGALFLLNAAVSAINAPRFMPGATPALAAYAYIVDVATGPVFIALLARRLLPRGGGVASRIAWMLGAAHAALLLVGHLGAPGLWQQLVALDPWLRAAPLFAGWILAAVALTGGDRVDRWIGLAWATRAATWGVHGPQRLLLNLESGVVAMETLWLVALLVAAAIAAWRLHWSRDPRGAVALTLLGAATAAGIGMAATGNTGPHTLVDHVLLVYVRGTLVLIAFEPAALQRLARYVVPAAALSVALFHGLRINHTPTDLVQAGTTLTAYTYWALAAGAVALVALEGRQTAIGVHAESLRAPKGYRVLEVIRDGAAGTTTKGVCRRTGDDVVLKFLPWGSGIGQREARALDAVRHPNVVTLRDQVVMDGRLVLVTDLVPGRDLAARLRDAESIDAQPLARGLLDGLAALHASGVIHGDVKPSNILVTPEHDVCIIDLGIARTPADDATLTITAGANPLGTPHYMAPEVAIGSRPTPAADVWGAAAILYEVMAGHPYLPTDGTEDTGTLIRRAANQGDFNGDVPGPWRAWFEAALTADPAQRFRDAAAARAGLPANDV